MIIDKGTANAEITKSEVYWQHCQKTFLPNGLNEDEESCF